MENSIEKHMETSGVTPEELCEALYCVKVAMIQNNPVCDCPACRGSEKREQAQVELAKKAIELGIMDERQQEEFWKVQDAKNSLKKAYSCLSGFYEKMSALLPEDMLCTMEARAQETGDKVNQLKEKLGGGHNEH